MTCLTCHWIHTSPDAGIACYRRAVPDPVSASSSARARPVDLAEVSITAAPDELAAKAAHGGRPRRHASDLAARLEAQRAYRRRRAGAPHEHPEAEGGRTANTSHVGNPEDAPSPCGVLVEFFDGATGVSLKTARLSVPSGQTQSADLGVTELVPLTGKVSIYARVTIGDPNARPACSRPSLEVFDKATGGTAAGIWNPGDRGVSEAFFPGFPLVTGLTLRFNAVNYGDPDQAPCPVLLTIFAADGRVLAQQRPIVASGVGTFLDAAIGNPDARVQLRAAGSRAIEGRDQKTLCRAFVFSVEVFDLATGITTLIIGDPNI